MTIITSRNAPIDIYMEAPLVGLSREEVHSKRPSAYKTKDQESHRDAWSLVRYKCAMIRYEKTFMEILGKAGVFVCPCFDCNQSSIYLQLCKKTA